jgi:hypothetical protein
MNKPLSKKSSGQPSLFLLILLLSTSLFLLVGSAQANPPGVTVTSVNAAGQQTEVYTQGEAMCISATGLAPTTTYDFYVVNHIEWAEGTVIPERIAGTATTVTTDETGALNAFVAWEHAQPSVTDMVIDINGDGIYNEANDALEDNHVTNPLQPVPENPLSPLIPIFACIAAFAAFTTKYTMPRLRKASKATK